MKNTREIYRIANDLVKEMIDRTETFGEALLVADAIKNMMVFKEMFIRDEVIKETGGKMNAEIKGKFDYRWSSQGVELVISSPDLSCFARQQSRSATNLNKQLDKLFRKKVTVKIEEEK